MQANQAAGTDEGTSGAGSRSDKTLTLKEYSELPTAAARADRVDWREVEKTAREHRIKDTEGGSRYSDIRKNIIYNDDYDVYVIGYADNKDANFRAEDWKSLYVVVVDAKTGKVKLAGPLKR